ncbi:MAG TPA: hypothetical protein VG602_06420, partial [Actinomycetota bacterium]|nr:hypothetical protein [Actinomycetota bacterium]
GVHHVAWTEGGQVLYANNAEGEFSKPEVVSQGPASGVSMAVSDDGTAFIAFYEQPRTAEGPTSLVRVATDGGGNWTVETAAEAEPPDGATTSIGTTSTGPMVAFGDSSGTVVARRADGDVWQSDVADPAGGTGVDMAVDPDGNPHVSYLTADGAVRHAHSIDGGPWEITDVADGPAVGRTAIALTEDGVHHVAWQDSELGVTYASNQEGDFAPETVGGTEGGTLPDLAAGADGIVYLAWHDSANAELQLATRTEDELLLAVPSPEAAPPGAAPEEAECQPEGTDLTLTAPQGAVTAGWAETCLAVEAGQPFTVQIVNQDAAPHNLGIYTSQGGENLFSSSPPTNPGATDTFDVPPIEETGNLYFQCDLHPTTMTGTFVVAAGGGAEGGGGGQAEQDTDGGGGGNQ